MKHSQPLRGTLRGKALEAYKKTLVLNDTQRDIIVGSLLGDGTMGLREGKPLYSIKFEQSVKHEQYIYHLAEEFKGFWGSGPSKRWIDRNKTREAIWFRTYRHDAFIFYFNLFYTIHENPETKKRISKKIVPSNIAKFLNPRVLAYWFMEDGTCHRKKSPESKQYYFSTQGFEKTECELLCKALHSSLNIQSSVHKDGKTWKISIRQQSVEHFCELISPYIVEDFKYKL